MLRLVLALAVAATSAPSTSGPTPVGPGDATPLVRGVVNTSPAQRLRGKVFVDQLRVEADAGSALSSSCVVNAAALGACPAGNGLQCVADAGWFACQPDAGWAQLGTGTGGSGSVSATAPLQASGGNVAVDQAGKLQIRTVETAHIDGGDEHLSGNGTAVRYISTDTAGGAAMDGGGNFICANNVAQSSPCLTNPIGPLEIGGYYNDNVSTNNAAIYLGAMFQKLGGPIISVLNNYGQTNQFEFHALDVMYDGDGVFGKYLHLGSVFSDSRIFSDNGPLYVIADHSIYIYNRSTTEDVQQWFSGPGTTVMTLGSTGGLQLETGPSRGNCTLNGASPSTCTHTVLAGALCGCFATGTTAAAGIALAESVSSTTLTCTGPNGSTAVVNFICL